MGMSLDGRLWIISGARGAGKTSLCARLVEMARQAGWDRAGLLSPAVFEGGVKTGIAVTDLRGGETRTLARLTQPGETAAVRTVQWAFDEQVLAWGDRVLAQSTPCDLLVVDELGPLEFQRGQGWLAGLAAVDSRAYRLGLLVLRPELLETAAIRWPDGQVYTVDQGEAAVRDLRALLAGG